VGFILGTALGTSLAATAIWAAVVSRRSSQDPGRPVLALNDVPGLFATFLADGRLEFLNGRSVEFFGRDCADLGDWADLIPPEDREQFVQRWHSSLRTGQAHELELRIRRADGAYRWMHARLSPQHDRRGQVLRWCALLDDIDDRRRANAALRASEQALRIILDNIPGFVFTLTPGGEIEQVNQRIVDYFGLQIDNLRDWRPHTHPDDVPTIAARLGHCLRTGDFYEVESRGMGADGNYRWFNTRGVPIRDGEGVIIRWCMLLIDIDDRKRAEEAIRDNERQLQLIFDTIPAFIHTLSPTGEIEYVNQPILDFFGLPEEGLRDWSNVTHPEDIPRVAPLLERSLRTGTPFECESRGRRADGVYRWLHARGMPLRDREGRIVRWYHVVTDVDDRKRAEESLRVTRSKLSRAIQLATAGELSASIAHEINQPLSAVLVNGHVCHSMLSASPPNIQSALTSLSRIIRDSKSAADVIQRIRSLYRHAPPVKNELNINDVIREVCGLVEGEISRHSVTLHLTLDSTLPVIRADRVQIQQLLFNLARNAIEAMEGVVDRTRELHIASLQHAGYIIVEVRDTGCGMEDYAAAFESFFTTKSNGMGIGLAICRSIVEAHGGTLSANGGLPFGSVFRLSLPAMEPADLSAPGSPMPAHAQAQ
jgi:PAS domain S-box-containing protein